MKPQFPPLNLTFSLTYKICHFEKKMPLIIDETLVQHIKAPQCRGTLQPRTLLGKFKPKLEGRVVLSSRL